MENILNEIGLSLDSNKSNPVKRSLLNNPVFILINTVLFLSFSIAILFTNNIDVLIVVGDLGHILHFKVQMAIIRIIYSSIIIAYQIISFIAHRRGEKQPFVDLMEAISGSRNPPFYWYSQSKWIQSIEDIGETSLHFNQTSQHLHLSIGYFHYRSNHIHKGGHNGTAADVLSVPRIANFSTLHAFPSHNWISNIDILLCLRILQNQVKTSQPRVETKLFCLPQCITG